MLVEQDDTRILIDTTPDLREQLLAAGVGALDGVLYTHAHADHCHGIDDLRELCRLMQRPVPIYGDAGTLEDLKRRFAYCFPPLKPGQMFYRPVLEANEIAGPFRIGTIDITPFRQDHGWVETLGFRCGGFAYSTDVVRLDKAAFAVLEGVAVWVVDCQRLESHPVHSHLEQTLAWIDRVRPQHAWLTHMGHTLDYETLRRRLPPGVEPAYDGLVIEL